MALRLKLAAVAAGVAVALLLAAASAGAATQLGSRNPGAEPSRYACSSGCTGDADLGFRQVGLLGATLEAPEPGVLVSARVYARRLGGTEEPRVAVLRPTEGIGVTIVGSAPVPVSPEPRVYSAPVQLPVAAGDSLGFIMRTGAVDLGVRTRPAPDGAVVRLTFGGSCAPCAESAGTEQELLFAGTVEPDEDRDGLGDESQDPDGGGFFADDLPPDLGEDLDPFEDELVEDDPGAEEPGRRRRLRVLRASPVRDGRTTLVVAVPGPGRVAAEATVRVRDRRRAGDRRNGARRVTVASGRTRAASAGRVQLRLRLTDAGRRLLARRDMLRSRLEVVFRPATGRRLRLRRSLTLRPLR